MGDDMQAYREVFASESAEYVQSIIDGMLRLESDPSDLEPVETVFRGAHSLKGMAAAMGYERTADLTHKMETLMDTVRRREQSVDEELADLILRAVDVVKALIEDERDRAVAQDRGSTQPAGVADHPRQGLDHDLLAPQQSSDRQPARLSGDLDEQDVLAVLQGPGVVVVRPHEHVEPIQRHDPAVTKRQHGAAVDRGRVDVRRVEDLAHERERQSEGLPAGVQQQRLDDRQREGEAERELGAPSKLGADRERAAQVLDLAAHDVHPDAAARDRGGFVHRRESGGARDAEDLLVRVQVARVRGHEPAVHGLDPYPLDVHASAVVRDDELDLVALPRRYQTYGSARLLAGRRTHLGSLHTVVHGVAQQVDERIHHLVKHGTVELDVEPFQLEGDVLAQVVGEVAHHAGEPVEYVTDRHHARLHHLVLELGGDALELLEGLAHLRSAHAPGQVLEPRTDDHELPDQVDHVVEVTDRDAHGLSLRQLRDGPLDDRGLVLSGRGTCLDVAVGPSGDRCLLGLLYLDMRDLAHGRYRGDDVLHPRDRGEHDLEPALERLVFQVARGRVGLDHLTHVRQPLHHHVRAHRLEDARRLEGDAHEHIPAGSDARGGTSRGAVVGLPRRHPGSRRPHARPAAPGARVHGGEAAVSHG
jgi:chemotaxis protein histidine kinase CheA